MRKLADYFDPNNTGEIHMSDVLKALHELISQSDQNFVFIQTQQIFTKVIKELAMDCKAFLDTLSKYEQMHEDTELAMLVGRKSIIPIGQLFKTLNSYEIYLDEDEKTILA